jgi:hypothetical protein
MNDNNSSLTQLHKLIRSLRRQEIEQIQQMHGDALKQIATIVREKNLSLEHIQVALSVRTPKDERHERPLQKQKRRLKEINPTENKMPEFSNN